MTGLMTIWVDRYQGRGRSLKEDFTLLGTRNV